VWLNGHTTKLSTGKKENAMSDSAPTIPEFNPSGSDAVAGIKARTEDLMAFIHENVPANRERSIAITNYEQAAMWAVKANFT
jgi:hypothetical protein